MLKRWLGPLTSIRTKFVLLSCLVVFVPIYLLNRHAVVAFDAFTRKAMEEEMISHARSIGAYYRMASAGADGTDAGFQNLLQELGPQLQSRLRVLSPAGIVLADSSVESMVGHDLSDYPEVVRAKQGRYGARTRLTEAGDYYYYYIALPLESEEGLCGIVHVLRHTGPIIKAIQRMVHEHHVSLWLALVSALLLSLVVAQTLTRRLRRLTARAREFAQSGRFAGGVGGHDEITELGRAMNRMTEDLAQRNRYNREFVATLMHELKAPLTAIRGAAEVLEDGAAENPPVRDKFLGNIRFEVDRVTRLVGELGELTKLDTEAMPEEAGDTDLVVALAELRDRLPILLDGEHAPVLFTLPSGRPLRVRLSSARLEQVVVNLLDNAIRYTPQEGEIRVVLEPASAGGVRIVIEDTGCGIAPVNLDKVFDRFFTTEPKGSRQDAGSGLGLAVVKSILERHHGSIRVASVPGEGACFTIELPRVTA